MSEEINNIHRRIHSFFNQNPAPNGWCDESKALALASYVHEMNSKVAVEVGVFAGRSLIPIGFALDQLKADGVVYGIDPWDARASIEDKDNTDKNAEYWKNIDYEAMYREAIHHSKSHNIFDRVKLLRLRGDQAVRLFDDNSVDFIHIDGNHSESSSIQDVKMWFPKLRKGSYIAMDDTSWTSTQKAVALLSSAAYPKKSGVNWTVFRKHSELEIKEEVL